MKCEACENGDHDNCGMQTWCDCDCEGFDPHCLPTGYAHVDDADGGRAVKVAIVSPEDDPFIRAIMENLDDAAPRLIYADFVQERGDSERAALIRGSAPCCYSGKNAHGAPCRVCGGTGWRKKCEHEGCQAPGDECNHDLMEGEDPDDPDRTWWYCSKHAHEHGFCWACGAYWGGDQHFENSQRGMCYDCEEDWRREEFESDPDPYLYYGPDPPL